MKKLMATLAVAMVMSATVALAATPATPVFNTPIKVSEGKLSTCGNRIVIDGATIYVPFGTTFDQGAVSTARIATSTNSGATWGRARILASEYNNPIIPRDLSVRAAVSNDPLYPGKKIVHAIWSAWDTTTSGPASLYYAFKADRPTQAGWSTPVKITDNIFNDDVDLAVASNGVIHIMATKVYSGPTGGYLVLSYLTAASPDSSFTATDLPLGWQRPQMVLDSAGTIYVIGYGDYVGNYNPIQLIKKVGSAAWTTPVTVFSAGPAGDFPGLAVVDANTYYVSYFDGTNSCLSFTTNGGKTWTQRIVVANQVVGNYYPNPVVAVSPTKVITYVTTTNDTVKVYRSSDNGATWSAPATVKGQLHPTITLDSSNKAHIVTLDEEDPDWGNPNILWIKEK
jgi:hypothetical protein